MSKKPRRNVSVHDDTSPGPTVSRQALVQVAQTENSPAFPKFTFDQMRHKQGALLSIRVSEEVADLIVELRKIPHGVEIARWDDVDVAPVAKAHFAIKWNLTNINLLAALYGAVDEAIEEGFIPRRIRIPRYGSAIEDLKVN
jgi:hypothetical protein